MVVLFLLLFILFSVFAVLSPFLVMLFIGKISVKYGLIDDDFSASLVYAALDL